MAVDENDGTGLVRVWPSRTLINVMDPKVEDIHLPDIAWALARVCRYGGHVEGFISVAEHSIIVAHLLYEGGYEDHTVAQGLMHDASEAYLGDMVGPLKHLPEMASFREAEDRMDAVIRRRFDLPTDFDPAVKEADREAGRREREGMDVLRDRTWPFTPSMDSTLMTFLELASKLGLK